MHAVLLVLASAAVGVDWGYRPLNSGGIEYILQVEPRALEELARGGPEIIHTASPDLHDIRKCRVTVGQQKLPRGGRAATPAEQVAADGVQVSPAKLEADGREHIIELDTAAIEKMKRDMDLVYDLQDVRRFRIRLKPAASSPPLAAAPGGREVSPVVELSAPPAVPAKPPITTPSVPAFVTPPPSIPSQPLPQRSELPSRTVREEPKKIEIPPALDLTEPPQLPFRTEPKTTPVANPPTVPHEPRDSVPSRNSSPFGVPPIKMPSINERPADVSGKNSPEPELPEFGFPGEPGAKNDPFAAPMKNAAEPARKLPANDPAPFAQDAKPFAENAAPRDPSDDPFSVPSGNPLRSPPGFETPKDPVAPATNSPPQPFPGGNSPPPSLNSVPPLEGLPPLNFGSPPAASTPAQPPVGNSFTSRPPTTLPPENPPLGNQRTSFSGPMTEPLANAARNPRSFDAHDASPPAERDTAEPAAAVPGQGAPPSDNKPWWGVTGALMALFASLGGNAYLGWMNFDLRRQYASLLDMLKQQRTAKSRT